MSQSSLGGVAIPRQHSLDSKPASDAEGTISSVNTQTTAKDPEVAKLKEDFRKTTGGSDTMTFENCMTFPEIADWLAKGITTTKHLREVWDRIQASDTSTETLNLEVSSWLFVRVTRFACRSWR